MSFFDILPIVSISLFIWLVLSIFIAKAAIRWLKVTNIKNKNILDNQLRFLNYIQNLCDNCQGKNKIPSIEDVDDNVKLEIRKYFTEEEIPKGILEKCLLSRLLEIKTKELKSVQRDVKISGAALRLLGLYFFILSPSKSTNVKRESKEKEEVENVSS